MQAGARTDSGLRPPTAGCQVTLQAGLRACEGHDTFTFPCMCTVVSRRGRSLTVAGAAPDLSWVPRRTGFPFHPARGGEGHLKLARI